MISTLSKFILGVELSLIRKNVIIAPCWVPESVGVIEHNKIADGSCQIWDCLIGTVEFTYIVMGVGAASCIDVVYALKSTNCRNIMFLGSAGALKQGINIGDFAVPYIVKSAEGASRYICDNLSDDLLGRGFASSNSLSSIITECLKEKSELFNVKVHEGVGISVESIFLQNKHLDEFNQMGCDFIDMEASAFLAACNDLGFSCVVVFCVSDNIADDKPLYQISLSETIFRKNVRRNLLPYAIEVFLNYGY